MLRLSPLWSIRRWCRRRRLRRCRRWRRCRRQCHCGSGRRSGRALPDATAKLLRLMVLMEVLPKNAAALRRFTPDTDAIVLGDQGLRRGALAEENLVSTPFNRSAPRL